MPKIQSRYFVSYKKKKNWKWRLWRESNFCENNKTLYYEGEKYPRQKRDKKNSGCKSFIRLNFRYCRLTEDQKYVLILFFVCCPFSLLLSNLLFLIHCPFSLFSIFSSSPFTLIFCFKCPPLLFSLPLSIFLPVPLLLSSLIPPISPSPAPLPPHNRYLPFYTLLEFTLNSSLNPYSNPSFFPQLYLPLPLSLPSVFPLAEDKSLAWSYLHFKCLSQFVLTGLFIVTIVLVLAFDIVVFVVLAGCLWVRLFL